MIVGKFPIALGSDVFTISMPKGAKILTVQTQHNVPCIWALIDTDNPYVDYKFRVVGTGHTIDNADELEYIDTFQLKYPYGVFHLFVFRPANS